MNSLNFYKKIFTFLFTLCIGVILAQPANDDCTSAISINLGNDQASTDFVDGNTLGGTASLSPSSVCSGSWFGDDIWFKLELDTIPEFGIEIETQFGDISSDVIAVGMGFYESCDDSAAPLYCFSNGDGSITSLRIPALCLMDNSIYYIRVWSGVSPTDNSGTFRIGAYGRDQEIPVDLGEVFYSEDFNDGANGWTSVNLSGVDSSWYWAESGVSMAGVSFSNSNTGCTGMMVFDGDEGPIPPVPADYTDFEVALVSPTIDATNFPDNIKLTFDYVYNGLNVWNSDVDGFGDANLYVQFSVDDGVTWMGTADITDGIDDNLDVEEFANVNLIGAGGTSQLRIRIVYNQDYDYTGVDNINLSRQVVNDLLIEQDFYAGAVNYVTPSSQAQEIAFVADIRNRGSSDQPNTCLDVFITNENGDTIFMSTKQYGMVPGSSPRIADQVFEETFMQPSEPGIYTGSYVLRSDSLDENVEDNVREFSFLISEENTFAKDNNSGAAIRYASGNWNDGENRSWGTGQPYYIPNGEGFFIDSLIFGADINDSEADRIAGELFLINLYEYTDANNDGDIQNRERTLIGFFDYEATGLESNELITVPLEANEGDRIALKDNMHVIAMVERVDNDAETTEDILLFTQSSDLYNQYRAASLAFDTLALLRDDVTQKRPREFGYTSGTSATPDFDEIGFANTVPLIRLPLTMGVVDVDDPLTQENELKVYPNPSRDQLNLDIQLVENEAQARVNIIDIAGKVIRSFEYTNVQQDVFTYDVSDLADGAYLLQYVSETGSRTMKFTKQ